MAFANLTVYVIVFMFSLFALIASGVILDYYIKLDSSDKKKTDNKIRLGIAIGGIILSIFTIIGIVFFGGKAAKKSGTTLAASEFANAAAAQRARAALTLQQAQAAVAGIPA